MEDLRSCRSEGILSKNNYKDQNCQCPTLGPTVYCTFLRALCPALSTIPLPYYLLCPALPPPPSLPTLNFVPSFPFLCPILPFLLSRLALLPIPPFPLSCPFCSLLCPFLPLVYPFCPLLYPFNPLLCPPLTAFFYNTRMSEMKLPIFSMQKGPPRAMVMVRPELNVNVRDRQTDGQSDG